MKIGSEKFAIRAKVVSKLNKDITLGSDFFRKKCAKIYFEKFMVKMRDDSSTKYFKKFENQEIGS